MVANYGEQFHHNNPSMLTDQLYLSAARALNSAVLKDLAEAVVVHIDDPRHIEVCKGILPILYDLSEAIGIHVENALAR